MSPFKNSIIHADCLKALPMLPSKSVDFILTDPPYLVNYKSRDGRSIRNDDNDRWLKPAFVEMYRVLADDSYCVSFYGWPSADRFMQAYRAAGFRVVGHPRGSFLDSQSVSGRHLRAIRGDGAFSVPSPASRKMLMPSTRCAGSSAVLT